MNDGKEGYSGIWLHHGDWQGKEFTHDLPEYDHDEKPGAEGATPMRHARLTLDGNEVAVWIPASWSDDQAREALETNW